MLCLFSLVPRLISSSTRRKEPGTRLLFVLVAHQKWHTAIFIGASSYTSYVLLVNMYVFHKHLSQKTSPTTSFPTPYNMEAGSEATEPFAFWLLPIACITRVLNDGKHLQLTLKWIAGTDIAPKYVSSALVPRSPSTAVRLSTCIQYERHTVGDCA